MKTLMKNILIVTLLVFSIFCGEKKSETESNVVPEENIYTEDMDSYDESEENLLPESGSEISFNEMQKMYVTANSGLVVRDAASTDGKKLTVIPFGKAVEASAVKNEDMTISGKTGRWTKVHYATGKTGWAFGGFLSDTAPNEMSESDVNKFLTTPEYGWVNTRSTYFIAFFKDGRLSLQGDKGEETMWEGSWKLSGNRVTLSCKEIKELKGFKLNATYTVEKNGDLLKLGSESFKVYKI
ncbi:MAG: SH3 domain-containing protein [Leptospiraceae bacterium]|nr:SH3 domain-containing protein [Leptospiraceae bacterium]